MIQIVHIEDDEILEEKVRKYEKPNNERLLSTTKETPEEKNFLDGLWLCLQKMSKGIYTNNFIYEKVDDINYSALANRIISMIKTKGSKEYYEKLIDIRTVAKGMKYFERYEFYSWYSR